MLSKESTPGLIKADYVLKGIISDQYNNYALISFQGNIFELKEGDIGGINNKFIPDGVTLRRIDINKKIVFLSLKDSELKLSMDDTD